MKQSDIHNLALERYKLKQAKKAAKRNMSKNNRRRFNEREKKERELRIKASKNSIENALKKSKKRTPEEQKKWFAHLKTLSPKERNNVMRKNAQQRLAAKSNLRSLKKNGRRSVYMGESKNNLQRRLATESAFLSIKSLRGST